MEQKHEHRLGDVWAIPRQWGAIDYEHAGEDVVCDPGTLTHYGSCVVIVTKVVDGHIAEIHHFDPYEGGAKTPASPCGPCRVTGKRGRHKILEYMEYCRLHSEGVDISTTKGKQQWEHMQYRLQKAKKEWKLYDLHLRNCQHFVNYVRRNRIECWQCGVFSALATKLLC